MSVNGGGWTLFYKNNNLDEEGNSYLNLLKSASGFISSEEDILSTTVKGVSPIAGLSPVSMMAMPMGSNSFSSVDFGNFDIAETVLTATDVVEGENAYQVDMSYVENGSEPYVFHSFVYNNGTFVIPTGEETSVSWFGNVGNSDQSRMVNCGGFASNHCLYFIRERMY